MFNLRFALSMFLCAGLALGCAATTPPPTASVRPAATPTVVPSPSISPTRAISPTPAATVTVLGDDQVLDAGTYRVVEHPEFPPILITVPDGWQTFTGWALRRLRPGETVGVVAVQFWDVDQVYAHPCEWSGTLFEPGPTVDDLVEALVDVPLRNATEPVDVTIDGYDGKYLEWSVPADMDFENCDGDEFQSWTGDVWGGGRSQQAPGQIDRLWIFDVDGSRLVIDAFEMPHATEDERQELLAVVESIRFER